MRHRRWPPGLRILTQFSNAILGYETELAFVESLSDFVTLEWLQTKSRNVSDRNRIVAMIIEVLPDPVVTVGLDGNPVYINRANPRRAEPTEGIRLVELDQNISYHIEPKR